MGTVMAYILLFLIATAASLVLDALVALIFTWAWNVLFPYQLTWLQMFLVMSIISTSVGAGSAVRRNSK